MGLETSKIPALPKVLANDPSRLVRATSEIANVLNALLRRGDIKKLGPADYTVEADNGLTSGEFEAALAVHATFNKPGVVTPATNISNKLVVPSPLTFTAAILYADVPPDGQAMICDINLNGTSLWAATPANRPTLADGDGGPEFFTDFDTTEAATGDLLSWDMDQVGSVYPGRRVTLILVCELTGE